MRMFPTGVTVVTSGGEEKAEGMTANAVISVSLDPLLFLVSVHKDARLNPRIREEGSFAVSILADDQEGLSRLFASPERSSGLPAVRSLGGGYGMTGAPLAAGALAAIECELEDVFPGGDHDLFLGRVVAVLMGDTRKGPLVYHEGGYPTLKPAAASGSSGAFVDSVRGFDARLRPLRNRRRRQK
jgi:flavin reductase (DIM6/NTAB) family NADH-FMN oxidoreductase RutF